MARLLLTDEQWDQIADVFPEEAATGRPRRDPRTIVDGIFWILRTGFSMAGSTRGIWSLANGLEII